MSGEYRAQCQKLMRWYPRAWRDENATILVDTLELHAVDEGRTSLSPSEAWSIRAHGLAARAAPRVLSTLAALALILCSVPLAGILLAASVAPGLLAAFTVAPYVGAYLLCVVVGGLMMRGGALPPEPAIVAGLLAVPAWTLGALAAVSWSVGFDEADAGGARSWFGDAFLAFAGSAWLIGAISVGIVLTALPRRHSRKLLRIALAAAVAVPGALTIGAATFIPSGTVLLCALVLVLSVLPGRSHRAVTADRRIHTPPKALTRRARRNLVAGAVVACVIGLGCVAFALAGSIMFPAAGDSTTTMQMGITGGSLATIATVLIGSAALRARVGNTVVWPTATLAASLGLVALAYATGVNGPLGWPLLLVAALLAGLSGGLLFRPILPSETRVRVALVVGISIALAVALGLSVILLAAFAAPVLAAVTAIVLLRGRRANADGGTEQFAAPLETA